MSGELKFVRGQRGSVKLVYEGYVYNKNQETKLASGHSVGYWRCEIQDGRKKVCPGKVIYGEHCGLEISSKHNHPPDPSRVEILELRDNIRQQAFLQSDEIPSSIIQQAVVTASPSVAGAINERNTQRIIRRVRQKKDAFQAMRKELPQRVEALKIKSKMKALVTTSKDGAGDLSEIFAKATENTSPDVVSKLSKEVLEKSLRRMRRYEKNRELRKTKIPKQVTVHNPENDLTAEESSAIMGKIQLDTEVPSYLQSQKGRKKLTWRGYLYNRDRKEGVKSFWKCEKTKVCHSRCVFSGGKVVVTCPHTHKPDITNLHKLAVRAKIRSEALSLESEITPATIAENLRHQVPEDLEKVISKDNIRHTLSYYRKKLSNNPNPSSVFKVESDSEEEQKVATLKPKNIKLESKMSPGIAPTDSANLVPSEEEIPQPEADENKENAAIKRKDLRKRIQKDFKPMLKNLRKTMVQQVGQMMADFEQNFFDYLVSVTEDSVGVLKTMSNENESDEEDEDCADEESTLDCDEEEVDDALDSDENGSDSEGGSEEENHNVNKSTNAIKNSSKKKSTSFNRSPKSKPNNGQKKTKRKSSSDEDDEEYNPPIKTAYFATPSDKYGLRSKNVSFSATTATTPNPTKKRKTQGTPIPSSKRKTVPPRTVSNADSSSSKSNGDDDNKLSPLLLDEEIKIENESENEEPESEMVDISTLPSSSVSEFSSGLCDTG